MASSVAVISIGSRESAVKEKLLTETISQVKGTVKETTGKLLGNKELEAKGKQDQIVGKVQNIEAGGRQPQDVETRQEAPAVLRSSRRIREGSPHPLGATRDGLGINFALFSAHATKG